MSVLDLNAPNDLPKSNALALAETNAHLEKADAEGRGRGAGKTRRETMCSSLGIQAAVSLHLVNGIRPTFR